MFTIAICLLSIIVCFLFGDWKNWKVYYPTILFMILGDVTCNFILCNNILWVYKLPLLKHTFSNLLVDITVYPSTLLIFIPKFPKGNLKRIIYISFFVIVYTLGESISLKIGEFQHINGWNIIASLIFNYIMFLIIILHHKKPLIAWCIALSAPHILIYLFKIPYSVIK